jgi:hypothetical protein
MIHFSIKLATLTAKNVLEEENSPVSTIKDSSRPRRTCAKVIINEAIDSR